VLTKSCYYLIQYLEKLLAFTTNIKMPQEENPINSEDTFTVGDLISLAEAAKLSGFSTKYLRDIAEKGRLKAKKIGRNWVTTLAAVEEYRKNRTHILKKDN
jgi:hypothetical protein